MDRAPWLCEVCCFTNEQLWKPKLTMIVIPLCITPNPNRSGMREKQKGWIAFKALDNSELSGIGMRKSAIGEFHLANRHCSQESCDVELNGTVRDNFNMDNFCTLSLFALATASFT